MTKNKTPEIITAKTTPAQLEALKLSRPGRFWFGLPSAAQDDDVIIFAGGTEDPYRAAARACFFSLFTPPARVSVAVKGETIPEGFGLVETFHSWAGVYTPAGRVFLVESRGRIDAYNDGKAAIIFQVDDVERLYFAAYPAGGLPAYLEGYNDGFYLTT